MFPQYIPDWYNPDSKIIKKRETELRVDILPSRGQIYVFGSDRPDLMRGPNPQGIVLDEFSYQKREVWDSVVQPIVRANPTAWVWFLFTPCGKNHAADIFNYGLTRPKEWKSSKLTIFDSGIFTPEQCEEAHATSLETTWKSEYLCEFIEGAGSVFRGVREAATATPQKPMANELYVMGVDLAKVQDFTVISVFRRSNNHQVYQDRFNTLEWPYQKSKIAAIAKFYNNALCVLDATGIGDPIADDLVRAGVAVDPIKITNETKKEMIEKLSISISLQKCAILPIEESFLEYDNYAYEIGPTGKIYYQAKDGYHDDIVTSHALANFRLQPVISTTPQTDQSIIRQEFIRQLTGRNRGQSDDYDEWES